VKKELSPAIGWTALVVAVLLVVFFGYRMMVGPPPDQDKKGGDNLKAKVDAGGKLYEPPAGVVPNNGGSGNSPQGYNLQPPPSR